MRPSGHSSSSEVMWRSLTASLDLLHHLVPALFVLVGELLGLLLGVHDSASAFALSCVVDRAFKVASKA